VYATKGAHAMTIHASALRVLGLGKVVGAIGFEPTTSRSRTERSTRLSHAPKLTKLNDSRLISRLSKIFTS
jgi:hypothetical protein